MCVSIFVCFICIHLQKNNKNIQNPHKKFCSKAHKGRKAQILTCLFAMYQLAVFTIIIFNTKCSYVSRNKNDKSHGLKNTWGLFQERYNVTYRPVVTS